jgi:uncharacterized membrane protein YeiH
VPDSLASILSLMDYAGLCLFALSGALVAAEKRQTPVTFAFFGYGDTCNNPLIILRCVVN